MKVIVFGATGMVGAGVLIECLEDARVTAVLAIGRTPTGVVHPKLQELIREDFFKWHDVRPDVKRYDACFFCLGVSSAGMDEETYMHLTYDLTIAVAETLASVNPGMTFVYVSGEGTDSSERGRLMWARVKGATENQLMRMPLNAFAFRPGFIQPMKGVRSKTRWYQTVYEMIGPLYPVLRRVFGSHMTTTGNVGKAMINAASGGYSMRVLENRDINALAAGHSNASEITR